MSSRSVSDAHFLPQKWVLDSYMYIYSYMRAFISPYPEMRGQRKLTIVAVCTFAYTSG